jgi:hypothetical protein
MSTGVILTIVLVGLVAGDIALVRVLLGRRRRGKGDSS